jgi:hypothetical protein
MPGAWALQASVLLASRQAGSDLPIRIRRPKEDPIDPQIIVAIVLLLLVGAGGLGVSKRRSKKADDR